MNNEQTSVPEDRLSFFRKRGTILGLIVLFVLATVVQILVLQNNRHQIDSALSLIQNQYREGSADLLNGEYSLFLFGPDPPSDANVLAHPPGYSIFGAIFHFVFGRTADLRIAQILIMSLAPIVVWLIAIELQEPVAAWLAAALTSLSPQLSYNAQLMLPDAIAALIILVALYGFVIALNSESMRAAALCAILLGISCWFRANGILIPAFFAAAVFLLYKKKSFRFAAIILAVFLFVISPITIRNYVGFRTVIPLSLGIGLNLVEGIGDFDKEGRFQAPSTDKGVMDMEGAALQCPDCSKTLYGANGVDRERFRKQLALSVIWSDPLWFGGVLTSRALSFFRFERVPAISNQNETSTGIFYYLNIPLKFFQKAFITAVFLPLLIGGVLVLLWNPSGRRKLAILFLIPVYYVCVHSWIHTEYRYILAMQPCFIIISSIALSRMAGWLGGSVNHLRFARAK